MRLTPPDASPALRRGVAKLWRAHGRDPAVAPKLREAIREQTGPDRFIEDTPYQLEHILRAVPPPRERARKVPQLQVVTLEAKTSDAGGPSEPLAALLRALRDNPQADVMVAPEWFFLPKDRLHTEAEVRALREALLSATAGRDVLLVAGTVGYKDARGRYHNTALVIANGELLAGYDKCADGGDADLARRHGARFARGSETPIVRWRGLDVGIEICRDHGDGLLRFRLLTASRARVDLHVVVSAGVGPRHVAAGLGGVLVHVDGCTLGAEEACSTVVRRRARKDEAGREGEASALSHEITARRFLV